MNKIVNHSYTLPLETAKANLRSYQRDMIFEMLQQNLTRTKVVDFVVAVMDDVDAVAEKAGVPWIATPTTQSEWARLVEEFPAVFINGEILDEISNTVDNHPDVVVEVRLDNGYALNVKTLINNY